MDDLDFLLEEAQPPHLDPAQALEAVRADLLDWASQALVARHPELRKARGTQVVAHGRRDMDAHVRHLHAALIRQDASELTAYLRWAQQQERHASLPADLEVLHEALRRFLLPEQAEACGQMLKVGTESAFRNPGPAEPSAAQAAASDDKAG